LSAVIVRSCGGLVANEKEEKNASNDNKKYYSYAKENTFSKCICRIFLGGGRVYDGRAFQGGRCSV